jgi:Tubulin binding cofactor C/Clathrin light chain
LDYTSEVDVTNCVNCQIFVGPVDGPAIFDACQNCNVAVACQQFQAKGCTDCSFGLYCATVPTISGCSSIKVSCWSGAYAGLNAHFAAANLDPTKNQWNKIYDASAVNDQPPNFVLNEDAAEPWEVTVDGADGPAENPVPGPVGAAPSQNINTTNTTAGVDDVSNGLQNVSLDPADAVFISENGNDNNNDNATVPTDNPSAADAAASYDYEPPSTAVARDQLSDRLSAQAREESDKRAAAQAAAARYLEEFYQKRNSARDARIAHGRDELARRGSTEAGPEGESVWEQAISMVDFNAARPGGTDLSRFKSVLFACKERGVSTR